MKRSAVRILSLALGLLVAQVSVCGDMRDQVIDRIVSNWRWSHYWLERTGIDAAYSQGKRISALVFWTKNNTRPIRGLCSADLSLCLAYAGVYLDTIEKQMQIPPGVVPRQALASFVKSGFSDSARLLAYKGFRMADFDIEERTFTLPALDPPSSISRREVPKGAVRAAKDVAEDFTCWSEPKARPHGCTGTLVFAYRSEVDPCWFVLRTCSNACESGFRGESVESLTPGDHGEWFATAGGLMSRKEEVGPLKPKILGAKMFRLQLPSRKLVKGFGDRQGN
jgi:hypothetical protein